MTVAKTRKKVTKTTTVLNRQSGRKVILRILNSKLKWTLPSSSVRLVTLTTSAWAFGSEFNSLRISVSVSLGSSFSVTRGFSWSWSVMVSFFLTNRNDCLAGSMWYCIKMSRNWSTPWTTTVKLIVAFSTALTLTGPFAFLICKSYFEKYENNFMSQDLLWYRICTQFLLVWQSFFLYPPLISANLARIFLFASYFEIYPFNPFWKSTKGVKLLEKQQSKIGLYIRVLARHSSVTLLESETQVSLACIAGRERHSQVAYFIRFMDMLRWGIQLGIPRVVYLWTYFKLIFLK